MSNMDLIDICLKVLFVEYFSGRHPFRAQAVFAKAAIENLIDIYTKNAELYQRFLNGFIKSYSKTSGFVKIYGRTKYGLDELWDYSFEDGTLIIKYRI